MNILNFESEREFGSTAQLRCFPLDSTLDLPVGESRQTSRLEQGHDLSLTLHDPEVIPFTKGRRSSETNQRQFSRCPIPEEGTAATLRINGRTFGCQLVELSIGGFGVVVSGSPQFAIGTEGNLRAPGLNYVVQVTRQEARPEGTFIGLRQIREVLDYHRYLSEEHSPSIRYLIAAVAGALIATVSYCFMCS